MRPRERFLAALAGQPTDRPSAANATSIACRDIMAATGRWFPEAHLDAEAMADLSAAGHERLGYDTIAPVFSVDHEAEALGCEVDWGRPDLMPEVRGALCRTAGDIAIPDDLLDRPACRVVLHALRILRKRYGDEVGLVGKVFGPWTLAYHLFRVDNFLILTIDDPAQVHEIIRRLKEVAVIFGKAQIEAGADALTVGDHATGDLVSAACYEEFLADIHAELAARIPCPLILHICGDTADRLPAIARTNMACFHFDSKVAPERARELVGGRIRLMGSINNPVTLLTGGVDDVRDECRRNLDAGIDLLAPECAVPLTTPERNLRAIAEYAEQTVAPERHTE